jgi:hypothetical protein
MYYVKVFIQVSRKRRLDISSVIHVLINITYSIKERGVFTGIGTLSIFRTMLVHLVTNPRLNLHDTKKRTQNMI